MQRSHLIANATRQHGLTLVEILVAVAVLGVIVAVAAPSLADMMERRRVVATIEELVSLFNYAKSETNVSGAALDLHLEPPADSQISCARLVTQSSFDLCSCSLPDNGVACKGGGSGSGASYIVREFLLQKSTGVSFEASAADWGAENHVLSFSRNLHYTAFQGFQLTVTGQRTHAQLRIEYNNLGRVHVCAPGGSLGGYPSCG